MYDRLQEAVRCRRRGPRISPLLARPWTLLGADPESVAPRSRGISDRDGDSAASPPHPIMDCEASEMKRARL